jgi:hypothetical protein
MERAAEVTGPHTNGHDPGDSSLAEMPGWMRQLLKVREVTGYLSVCLSACQYVRLLSVCPSVFLHVFG